MFGFASASRDDQLVQIFDATWRSSSMIQPAASSVSTTTSCKMTGYPREQMVGRHHSMFVEADYARSPEYREFWAKLARGEPITQEFKRSIKDGRDIWIQANYRRRLECKGRSRTRRQLSHRRYGAQGQEGRFRGDRQRHLARPGDDRIHPGRRDRRRQRKLPQGDGLYASTRSKAAIIAYSSSPLSRRPRNTKRCGKSSIAANMSPTFSNASARAARSSAAAGLVQSGVRSQGTGGEGGQVRHRYFRLGRTGGESGAAGRQRHGEADHPDVPADVRADQARLQHRAGEVALDHAAASPENVEAVAASGKEIASASENLSHRTEGRGREPRGNRGGARRCDGHGQEDRDRRKSGPRGGVRVAGATRKERRDRQPRGRSDGADREVLAADRPNHRRDRRDRLPDQPARRSTRASRRRGPATPARVSPSSPRKCARSPSAQPKRPRKSRALSPLRARKSATA